MNNKVKIYTNLKNGTRVEYDVILTFKSLLNNNNYCIYTDNTLDKEKKIRFYVAKYNPNLTIPYLGEPSSKEEWNEIRKVIDNVVPQA